MPIRRIGPSLSDRRHADASPVAAMSPSTASTRATPRKREALELFSGLPRRYDELSAALSFWQDPRWRRALVDEVAPQAGERILDVATGTGMVAAELLRRADCTVVGLDQSAADARRGARGALRRAHAPRERDRAASRARPSSCRSRTRASTRSRFTYLLRYVDDPAATLARAGARRAPGRARRLARVRRAAAGARARWPGASTRRSGCPRSAGSPRASGSASGASSVRASAASTRAIRSSSSSATGRRPGCSDVRVRRMSLGGGVVMSATRAGLRRWSPPARAAGLLRARRGAGSATRSRCCTRPTRSGT